MLSRWAKRIYISFADSARYFERRKVFWTGNPVRSELLASPGQVNEEDRNTLPAETFTLLVLGGSQGAHRLNLTVPEALKRLSGRCRLRVMHQTGAADEKAVAGVYHDSGIARTVAAFFDDMHRRYAAADLIICRAGATTVAEVTALGKAAVFIPFPYAADNHQELNARCLADAGAAEIIQERHLDPGALAARIQFFMDRPEALKEIAGRAAALGKPEAARLIVEDCYRLVESIHGR
jgi:UDP-N-acetylglucosamine--N-acetylmuramyl-(pentapeptide) pyrophosphoryl-undecaprenol N-acetylglucosamine transferase